LILFHSLYFIVAINIDLLIPNSDLGIIIWEWGMGFQGSTVMIYALAEGGRGLISKKMIIEALVL
jgi:hypothetical protein